MRGTDVHVHQPAFSDLDASLGHGAVSASLEAHLSALGGDALEVTCADQELDALAAQDDQAVGDPLTQERPHRSIGLVKIGLGDALLREIDQLPTDPSVRVPEILEEVLDPLEVDALRPLLQLPQGLFEASEAFEIFEALVHAGGAAVEEVEQRDACDGGGGHDELGPGAEDGGVDESVLHGHRG